MSKSITPLMDARLTAEGAERGRLKAAAERDALAQRCRELEACIAGDHTNLVALLRVGQAQAERERDALRPEVERLQRELATAHADASHYASSAEDMRAEVEQLRQQAARYERLRRLDPRQFAELHQRNLAGERFDDLVDAL